MNAWGIPAWLEREVRNRDKACVYCGVRMANGRKPRGCRRSAATWEHIINDASVITRDNIALCCVACNSSKGAMTLADWMQSTYCAKHRINKRNVAAVIRRALKRAVVDDA